MFTSPVALKSPSHTAVAGHDPRPFLRPPLSSNHSAQIIRPANAFGRQSTGALAAHATENLVSIGPVDAVKRRAAIWPGMAAELVQATSRDKIEYRFRAPVHLLAVFEDGSRDEGESFVEGLPRSTLRTLTRKITFVPAGHEYYEWHRLRTPSRLIYFYLDPAKLGVFSQIGLPDISLTPRLFFENAALWDSALKLKRPIEQPALENQLYIEALGLLLMHELVRLERGAPANKDAYVRGGLATYQQRLVGSYIEEHLPEQISIATLAGLAHLSPFHFCRAFKKSFGVPPHRYHTRRRIERAKEMLAKRTLSVTEIGFAVGFSETSSFCAAFRKASGLTPRGYQMNIG
jgi:AraC family transcriptional regulator